MLIIERLTKTYSNGVRALDGVDLRIDNGLFGLLGPNGAGKSTLMRTIAALQEADSGSLVLDGVDFAAHPDDLRRRLGYLPQDFGVYPGISAMALLDHVAVLKGILDPRERAEQVSAVLQLANLYEVRKNAVSTYSGGMKQRFGIAQALLGSPRLIIVDEPTAGLDPEERNRFHNLLSEIGEESIVLLSTHIVEDVSELCPKMAILARGRVLLEGSPAQLMAQLQGRLWRKPVPKASVESYRREHDVISTRLFAGETQVQVISGTRPDPGFEAVPPTLEDVYFATLNGDGAREKIAC